MKKIIFLLLFFCVSSIVYSQDTIVTAQGFEYTYYFNGNSWSQFNKSGTKLSMNLFVTNKDEKSLWLQNVSLRETELKKLMNYLDTVPRLAVGAKSYELHKLSSFEIYRNDNSNHDYMPMNKGNNKELNIAYVQSKIKEFFDQK